MMCVTLTGKSRNLYLVTEMLSESIRQEENTQKGLGTIKPLFCVDSRTVKYSVHYLQLNSSWMEFSSVLVTWHKKNRTSKSKQVLGKHIKFWIFSLMVTNVSCAEGKGLKVLNFFLINLNVVNWAVGKTSAFWAELF